MEVATALARAWGPALTQSFQDQDISFFRQLFADAPEPVVIVMQDGAGNEAVYALVDTLEGEGSSSTRTNSNSSSSSSTDYKLTWNEFLVAGSQDLEAQNYAKSEAVCLGVLGDRMILEVGRFNKEGEVYLESYVLVTVNEAGKVTMLETFTDPQLASLMSAVSVV